MIRHQVYFDTLGSLKEGTPSWRAVFAGLSVLRLVDSYGAAGSPGVGPNWAQLHSVRAAIEEMSEGNVVRGVLTGVLDAVTTANAMDDSVCASLMAYGRALDYEASWGLATDVFSTVAKLVKPEHNARLAVEANVAVGGAARRNGEWEISARGYSQAAFIADTLGDRAGVLTVQVGIANTYRVKGNLPQAESILDDVIVQARDQRFPDIEADALHGRAALASNRGDHAEGLKLAYEALQLTKTPAAREQILEDIGAMFTSIGLHDAARDAHLVLVMTAQSQFVRWSATLNLMELASLDHRESEFDSHARELARAPLGPWVRSHYLLFLGEGFFRFGREDAARQALSDAVSFAEANQIHQVAFKADVALAGLRTRTRETKPVGTLAPAELGVEFVVNAISELRKTALAAA